jgi:hypothetical protein
MRRVMTKVKHSGSENKLWKDPVVEELHDFREAYAKRFNYDLDAIFQDLKLYEKTLKENTPKRSQPKKKRA